jgi:hypothetical protein
MKIVTSERGMGMSYNIRADPDFNYWVCRCGRRNGNAVQQCESCGRKRPPQIFLGGKIR